jgi:hypothetical protein
MKLGIKSELGRLENTDRTRKGTDINTYDYFKGFKYDSVGMDKTVSIFDPVVCEIIYKWLCPDGGLILDPFAGGYTFLLVNLQYYWQWYLGLSAVEFISGFFLYSKFRQSQLKQ